MIEEEATSLNIAILASGEVADQAIQISQDVASSYPTEFILDKDRFLPHITVCQAHFPVRNISQVQEAIKTIVGSQKPFRVIMGEFVTILDTFLWWNCEKTESLQKLHDQIIKETNELRENLILPHLATITGMTDEDRADMQEYGALKIGPRFSPHITITRLSDSKDARNALNSTGLYRRTAFEVNELVIGYLGPNGTVNGVIETFKFAA